jgi:hypothetical protein
MKKRSGGKRSFLAGLIGRIVVAWAWPAPRHDPQQKDGGSDSSDSSVPRELEISSLSSLALLVGAAIVFVAWGLFVYSTVGMKWPPNWYFQNVEDLPGSGIYSTGVGTRFGVEPDRLMSGPPEPQHVMGRKEANLEPRR